MLVWKAPAQGLILAHAMVILVGRPVQPASPDGRELIAILPFARAVVILEYVSPLVNATAILNGLVHCATFVMMAGQDPIASPPSV